MSEAATLTPLVAEPAAAKPLKITPAHPWVGLAVLYWRVINQATGEIGALPAMLVVPSRIADGCWDLNFWQVNRMQGRSAVKFSKEPAPSCWTWPEDVESGPAKSRRGRPKKKPEEGGTEGEE